MARAGRFVGADVILPALGNAARKRVGLLPQGRAPMREGVPLFASEDDATQIGTITSGGFGPSVQKPVAMGYVDAGSAAVGTQVDLIVRGKPIAARIEKMPFITPGYKR